MYNEEISEVYMNIRCKRCFKVYDDLEYECPRCKKINDRDYNQKSRKDKNGLPQLIKVKKRYQCTFCGTKKFTENGACLFCGSDKIVRDNEMIDVDTDRIDELVDALYANRMSQNEVEHQLKEEIETLGKWRSSYEFKFGKRHELINFYVVYFIFSFIVFLWLAANVSGALMQFGLLAVVIGPAYLFVKPLQRLMHSESLNLYPENSSTDPKITFMERPEAARYKYETYFIDIQDLLNIKVTISDNKISKLRFISKSDTRKKHLDFEVETSNYDDQRQMKRFLVLYCMTYHITYQIHQEKSEDFSETVSLKEQYFIRMDTVKEEMTEDDLLTQSEYMQVHGDKVLLMGAVENKKITIIKTMSLEEAQILSSEDPLVVSGKITYDLNPLDITYKTIN